MYPDKKGQIEMKELSGWFTVGKKLNPENRWIKMAATIPWYEFEKEYSKEFSTKSHYTAHPARMGLGTLIIQRMLNLSDRQTVEIIKENPYLQFFIGLENFSDELPFHHTMLAKWRKRVSTEMMIKLINNVGGLETYDEESESDDNDNNSDKSGTGGGSEPELAEETGDTGNEGEIILDATCIPADIRYPTDVSLLNESQEKLEKIIDGMYAGSNNTEKPKARTYRRKAHQKYLSFAKQRHPNHQKVRKAVKAQLGFVKRDIRIIKSMLENEPALIDLLSKMQKRDWETIQKLFLQQEEMYSEHKSTVKDRIVSIRQPHIRPIVRGKANAKTEFGAKLSLCLFNGYAFIDRLQFDPYNESEDLIPSVERFKKLTGHYPKAVLADHIYRNRTNLSYCKLHHIRLSGPRLGRPAKKVDDEDRLIARKDMSRRQAVEGKFGEAKRFYGMNRNMGKTDHTSMVMIALDVLVLNIRNRLKDFLTLFQNWLFPFSELLENRYQLFKMAKTCQFLGFA